MACGHTINKYEGLGAVCQRSVDIPMVNVMARVVYRWCIHEIQAYVRMAHKEGMHLDEYVENVVVTQRVCPRMPKMPRDGTALCILQNERT